MADRRRFLRALAAVTAGGVALGGGRRLRGQEPAPGQGPGETGVLRDPASAGRARMPVSRLDNDPFITAVEKRLQCTCGCTLDIYTCRTTDFTCTYSPALHLEVVGLQAEGKTADEIVAAFVAKYGEKVLMAPKPEGFNLAGYLVPGLVVLLVGGVMFAILRQRTRASEWARARKEGSPVDLPAGAMQAVTGAPGATPEELARLERELREMDG